jgi:hypothetical protein
MLAAAERAAAAAAQDIQVPASFYERQDCAVLALHVRPPWLCSQHLNLTQPLVS